MKNNNTIIDAEDTAPFVTSRLQVTSNSITITMI